MKNCAQRSSYVDEKKNICFKSSMKDQIKTHIRSSKSFINNLSTQNLVTQILCGMHCMVIYFYIISKIKMRAATAKYWIHKIISQEKYISFRNVQKKKKDDEEFFVGPELCPQNIVSIYNTIFLLLNVCVSNTNDVSPSILPSWMTKIPW